MKIASLVFLLSLLGAGIPGTASAVVAIPIDGNVQLTAPSPSAVRIGDSFTMDLVGRGFTVELVGGGVNLTYDPAIVRVDSVVFDTTVWEFGPSASIDHAAGRVDPIQFATFVNSPTGDFHIATLHFTALAAGMSALNLSADDFFDFATTGATVPQLDFVDSVVNVSAVPEASVVGLMLAGLLLVGGRARLTRG